MDAYVGAVCVGGGFAAVLNWVARLVDPQAPAQFPEPETKRVKVEQPASHGYYSPYAPPSAPYSQGAYNPYAPPQQPAAPPPPMPMIPPPPLPTHNPLAPGQPQSAFLPLFNQTAQQRRLEVQYPAQFTGPAHAGRWTVQCLGAYVRHQDILTGSSSSMQSMVSRRVSELVLASSSPRKKQLDRRTMRWDGPLVRVSCTPSLRFGSHR